MLKGKSRNESAYIRMIAGAIARIAGVELIKIRI